MACDPANSTMAGYEHKVQEFRRMFSLRGWIFQLVISRCWNPGKVGSNASEAMNLLERQQQAGRELLSCFPWLYLDFQQKVGPRLKVYFLSSRSGSTACVILSQRSRLEMNPPTSNQGKIPSQVCPPFSGFPLIPHIVKLTTSNPSEPSTQEFQKPGLLGVIES